MARIYVASSWRNQYQPNIVDTLRDVGHQVYDFRNPSHGKGGFSWADMDPDWQGWTAHEYREQLLNSPVAAQGYLTDFRAMCWADTCVLVMPCGRSAHLELGWFAGAGKRTVVLLEDGEPELMTLMADVLCVNYTEMLAAVKS